MAWGIFLEPRLLVSMKESQYDLIKSFPTWNLQAILHNKLKKIAPPLWVCLKGVTLELCHPTLQKRVTPQVNQVYLEAQPIPSSPSIDKIRLDPQLSTSQCTTSEPQYPTIKRPFCPSMKFWMKWIWSITPHSNSCCTIWMLSLCTCGAMRQRAISLSQHKMTCNGTSCFLNVGG